MQLMNVCTTVLICTEPQRLTQVFFFQNANLSTYRHYEPIILFRLLYYSDYGLCDENGRRQTEDLVALFTLMRVIFGTRDDILVPVASNILKSNRGNLGIEIARRTAHKASISSPKYP